MTTNSNTSGDRKRPIETAAEIYESRRQQASKARVGRKSTARAADMASEANEPSGRVGINR